jgi:hypothetical protein
MKTSTDVMGAVGHTTVSSAGVVQPAARSAGEGVMDGSVSSWKV